MEGTVDRGRAHAVRIAAEGCGEHGLLIRELIEALVKNILSSTCSNSVSSRKSQGNARPATVLQNIVPDSSIQHVCYLADRSTQSQLYPSPGSIHRIPFHPQPRLDSQRPDCDLA